MSDVTMRDFIGLGYTDISRPGHGLPAYETTESAGMDVRACLKAPVTLQPLHTERRIVVGSRKFHVLPHPRGRGRGLHGRGGEEQGYE